MCGDVCHHFAACGFRIDALQHFGTAQVNLLYLHPRILRLERVEQRVPIRAESAIQDHAGFVGRLRLLPVSINHFRYLLR